MRASNSSVSRIFLSNSIALRRVFMSWFATAARPVSISPASTSFVRSTSCALSLMSSRLGLLLAAFEAILERCSALAGSWAQQYPCGPLAGALQGSPFALVARHTAISGGPPPGLPAKPALFCRTPLHEESALWRLGARSSHSRRDGSPPGEGRYTGACSPSRAPLARRGLSPASSDS